MIYSIFNKRDYKEVKNYRGITLLDRSYKIYANVLNEAEKKKGKTNMKKGNLVLGMGRGTSDAIYLLNFMVQITLAKKGGKMLRCSRFS